MSAAKIAGPCAYCGGSTQGNYSIHRDGFGLGPEVPLCDEHGSKPTPTCEEIWARIAARERAHAKGRFCGSISCADERCIEAECAALPLGGQAAAPAGRP